MFKKIVMLFLFVMVGLTLMSCDSTTGTQDPTDQTGTQEPTETKEPVETKGFTIHYYHNEADYKRWYLWLWEPSKEGKVYKFDGQDDYGVFITFNWSDWSNGLEQNKLGIIVRDDNWEKDVASDRHM